MKRALCLCLSVILMLMGTGIGEERAAMNGRFAPEPVGSLPDWQWQASPAFPDWKDYVDDTLAMNSMFSFSGAHGQGSLWLEVAEGVKGFTLYINGVKCDTGAVTPGIWHVDLSGAAVDGVNTLQLTNIDCTGDGKAVAVHIPYPEVLPADRGLEGIRPEAIKLIEDIIATDVAHGFTSAQLAIVRHGRLVYENAWGSVNSYNPDGSRKADAKPVTVDTMYDLASVTKMFSVNYAVQKLVTDGLLDVDAPIVALVGDAFSEDTLDVTFADMEEVFPLEQQKAWKRTLRLRDILCHQAGFPPSPHYNDPDYDPATQRHGHRGCNPLYAPGRADMLQVIFRTPLQYPPHSRTLYSDVDFMLATLIIEKLTGQRLDDYMAETFFKPLGLDHITFQPLEHGFTPDDCAATELNGNTRDGHIRFPGIRTETIQGEVHDERAYYCMEGVSGHAGLFASASDLAKLASIMLTGGYGEHRFFSRNVMDAFTAPKSSGFGQWGLGWYRQGDAQRPWYFGTQASPATIGHQGWTGTLAMIDPARDLVVVYLTNRINSPVLVDGIFQKFQGGCFTASTLGFVPQILSIGLDGEADVSEQLCDLLRDMASESEKLIPEDESIASAYRENARSKAELLSKYQ